MMSTSHVKQTLRFNRKPANVRLTGQTASAAGANDETISAQQVADRQASQAAANNAALISLLQKVETRLTAAAAIQQQSTLQLQQTAIELALVAAECLASKCVERGQFDVSEMVRRAIESCEPGDCVEVLVNPLDLQILNETEERNSNIVGQSSFKADPRINRGECVVAASAERLASTIGDRLESIRRAWMESLDDIAA